MDSLLADIPSILRRGYFANAYGLLKVFLISVFATFTELQQKLQKLETARDELVAQHISGKNIEDFDVLMASLDSAMQLENKALCAHEGEFRSCVPKLETIIINMTGAGFTDTVEKFTADFTLAARGMDRRIDNLHMAYTDKFFASYATVRGDGACFFRAFLTVLAYQLTGIILSFDPEGMHEWIIRLKLLMCAHIQKVVRHNQQFEIDLKSIPENGTVRTLAEYFGKFIHPAYQGTNYDCKILSKMFEKPIHVIRENPTMHETHQSFIQGEILTTEAGHINILYQPGHYVAIVSLYQCDLSSAIAPEF